MTVNYGRQVYIDRLCFYNNQKIVSVDLSNQPFANNNGVSSFYNCRKLTSVNNMNPNTTSLASAFYYCNSMTTPPTLPNSLTSLYYTFPYCYNLTEAPVIPNSVTNLWNTFYYCNNMVSIPQIPTSAIDMSYTFYYCSKLTSCPNIPNTVTDMYYTFYGCSNLTGNIYIHSPQITSAYSCFTGTARKDVYIPYVYSNGIISNTYDIFFGYWDEKGTTNGVYLHDLYSTYSTDWSYQTNETTGNAILIKYLGSDTSVSIPEYIE